jgi:hypothetical protein
MAYRCPECAGDIGSHTEELPKLNSTSAFSACRTCGYPLKCSELLAKIQQGGVRKAATVSTLGVGSELEFIEPATAIAAVTEYADLVFPEYQDDDLVVISIVDTLYYFSFGNGEKINELDRLVRAR